MCCARGRTMGGCFPGLAQGGDGDCVALSPGALDVVRAFGRAHTAGCERVGAPFVRAQPPACRRRLVDRPSHERMPEAKAARHVGLADQIELQQLVDGAERRRARRTAAAAVASSGSNGSPATAAPWSTRRASSGEERELFGQRGRNEGRHVQVCQRRRPVRRPQAWTCARPTGELLEIERIAAAVRRRGAAAVGSSTVGPRSSPASAARQGGELEAHERFRRARAGSSAADSRSGACRGPEGDHDEDGCIGWPAQQRAEQLDRRRSRPSGRRRARARAACVAVRRSSSSRTARWLR